MFFFYKIRMKIENEIGVNNLLVLKQLIVRFRRDCIHFIAKFSRNTLTEMFHRKSNMLTSKNKNEIESI